MRRSITIALWAGAFLLAFHVGAAVESIRHDTSADAARATARRALDRDGYSHVEEIGTSCFISSARDRKGEAVWAWACPNGKKYTEPPKQTLDPDEL